MATIIFRDTSCITFKFFLDSMLEYEFYVISFLVFYMKFARALINICHLIHKHAPGGFCGKSDVLLGGGINPGLGQCWAE